MDLLAIWNVLNEGNSRRCLTENKIIIKPFPFSHSSMQAFLNDINLQGIGKSDLIFKILYEGYTPSRFGGTNTTGIYLIVNCNTNFTQTILDVMREQMLDLKLEFKCLIKFTISL